ncbi:hypothetical protein [Paenibacillus pinihumi]|uniref:hypothetical protein n=1 Tax=Paenibacillus pinihumi TaxID=669462 RepID=UPI0004294FF5|nr:hypothetical protein [Paenibacillus pinihumi]
MTTKHMVIIHGRDKKPTEEEMTRLVRTSLIAGLRRIDEEAAAAVESERIKLTFIYYGDINNAILIKHHCELQNIMQEKNGNWYVYDGFYDRNLERLLNVPTDKMTKEDYELFMSSAGPIKYYDDLARLGSPVLSFFGGGSTAIKALLPDLGAYLLSRVVGSQIRERLQCPLRNIMGRNEDVALISHSMGCMVSYDVLWKFSRMSEYRSLWDKKVNLWMTLGNPLGEPAVLSNLYDADEPKDGRYPTNIVDWVNISAQDDYVAHDGDIADDFRPMLGQKLIRSIEDYPRIYTFWQENCGKRNPHNLFAYLNHPVVARRLVDWIHTDKF